MGGHGRARRTIELPVVVLVSLIHRENLGDPHAIFAGGERYFSFRFAEDTDRQLRAELTEAGLDSRDQIADFTAMLSVIQRAGTEFYGWVCAGGEKYTVLVAAKGRAAFAVSRRGDRVAFDRADPDHLAENLVRLLPNVPPGHGQSITTRADEFAGSGARPAGSVMRRSSGPVRSEQARRLDGLLRAPRNGGAKLYAARRDHTDNRARSRAWVDLLDLPEGRWLVHTTVNRGAQTINAVPGTPQLISAKLADLLRSAG